MANIPVGFHQIAVIFAGSALPHGAVCTLGAEDPTGGIDSTYTALLEEELVDLHEAISTSNCTLVELQIKRGPTATGMTDIVPVNAPGGQGTEAVPSNTALLIRKDPLNLSNRFAGRMFWPCAPEAQITSAGAIAQVYGDNVQVHLENLWSSMDGVGATPQIFSATTGAPRPVQYLTLQAQVATQRRRLRG